MNCSFKILSLTLIFFLYSIQSKGQKVITKFYDYSWRECGADQARFYTTIENTDSGWLRNDYFLNPQKLQMRALYKDEACKIKNGTAIYVYANGNLQALCRFIDDKRDGLCVSYHYNGMMSDSGNYQNGKLIGYKLGWYPNGNMSDSVSSKDDSTTVQVNWFDNGNPSSYGYFINNKKHGKWNYFHKNGKQAATELNDHGKVISVSYYNEDGSEQTDTSKVNTEATFKSGNAAWSNYLADKTFWPEEYKLTNTNRATVVTQFTINEEGKIEDAFVVTPFHPLMDKIALDAIKKSPIWKPAIDHNRKIKAYRRQPHTFLQE